MEMERGMGNGEWDGALGKPRERDSNFSNRSRGYAGYCCQSSLLIGTWNGVLVTGDRMRRCYMVVCSPEGVTGIFRSGLVD